MSVKIIITSQIDGGVLATYHFDNLDQAEAYKVYLANSDDYALCDIEIVGESDG